MCALADEHYARNHALACYKDLLVVAVGYANAGHVREGRCVAGAAAQQQRTDRHVRCTDLTSNLCTLPPLSHRREKQ
jgi:hypothetical protein